MQFTEGIEKLSQKCASPIQCRQRLGIFVVVVVVVVLIIVVVDDVFLRVIPNTIKSRL